MVPRLAADRPGQTGWSAVSRTATSADEARHRLYEIMNRDLAFERKATEVLELGRTYLGVESGFLTRVDTETDHWETVITTDGEDGLVPTGLTTELSGTYCRHTLERESPLALHNGPAQGDSDNPASDDMHCYHGTTLTVGGEPYGTVCFVAREPREEPFSEAETMFAELIGRLLGHELEYQRQQNELARQTTLGNLLDRVLRHNIRNKNVNNSAATIFGRPAAQLTGRRMSEFTEQCPGDRQPVTDGTGRLVVDHDDGTTVSVEYTCQPDIVPGQHLLTLEEQ